MAEPPSTQERGPDGRTSGEAFRPISRERKLLFWGILVFGLFVLAEVFSFVAYTQVIQPRAPFLHFSPAQNDVEGKYEEYLREHDPNLGWPAVTPSPMYDASGSRPVPAFAEPGNECMALYGDSFVYGDEVEDVFAWGNLLSQKLDCRVANYGVVGYGTDQAYLRFKQSRRPVPPVTILGIFPHNVMRNVNQYRYLLAGGHILGFKPRFVLENGSLRLVPLPKVSSQDFKAFRNAPEDYLKEEAFLPDSAYGPERVSFPYTLSLIQLALKERTKSWFMDRPSWLAFARPGHPTRSMEITSAIVTQFEADSSAAESEFLVILFPTPSSFEWYRETGTLALDLLAEDLQANGIPVLDLTVEFDQRLVGRTFCEILTRPEICEGHLNPEGNAMLAEILVDYLEREQIVDLSNQAPLEVESPHGT